MKNVSMSKTILSLGAIAALLGVSASAQAQSGDLTFTFTSKSMDPVVMSAEGSPYVGSYLSGTNMVRYSNGKTTSSRYSCVSMSQPPKDQIFDLHMICDGTDKEGSWSATMGCTIIDAAKDEMSCIGALYGKSGAYAGRRGSLTNHGIGNDASGTGQWFR
ncbi:hypothetical protein A8B75_00760 [Sphingomonadales bacterium EhC05]|nr:hypothetical protein A8B75_00760 [Sphingomonadales bacterium EhC05]